MCDKHRSPSRPAWVSVDLGAIRDNIDSVQRHVGPGVGVLAVVKSDAYGHGIVPVSKAALEAGAAGLAVAIPEEGITLREAGVAGRILILGICEPAAARDIVRYDLETSLSTPELLAALASEAARQGLPAKAHVKIDSGMGRVGVLPDDAHAFIQAVAAAEVEWVGIMTHFATSDEDDLSYAREQWRRFRSAVESALRYRKSPVPLLVHASNSAGACRMPETYSDLPEGTAAMVRSGLLTYGIPPAAVGPMPPLRPALSLHARVTQVRSVPAGTNVSYGATFTTSRRSLLAIVPLGYADGYSRANSNRAGVLLRGKRAPVLGRVCMDQFVVDATDTGAEIGDEIVLIGRQGDDEITVLQVAEWSGTIHHEVLSRLAARLPRVYEG